MASDFSFGRREFLWRAASAIALGSGVQTLKDFIWAGPAFGDEPSKGGAPAYKISPWTGDDFTLGHKLRAGELPQFPKAAERTVEFAIIGGGMSGLSTAHYLKDHNYLLLEQYDSLGGQSRGGSYNGIGYSWGAAYIGKLEGQIEELVSELKLKPSYFYEQKNAWHWGDQWFLGNVTQPPRSPVFKNFYKFFSEQVPPKLWHKLSNYDSLASSDDAELQKLDATPFAAWLNGYDSEFIALMDGFLKSCNCLGVNRSSALSALTTCTDLMEPSNVFEGGNPAIARALAERIEKEPSRSVKGAFVWAIEVGENATSVVYSTADGAIHRVNCRFAIVCTPPMVSARILKGISDESRAQMLSFKYGSYLVANLLLRKKQHMHAFDNWVSTPYTFADITVADQPYEEQKHYKPEMGSVLTIYQPYEPGTAGRPLLLGGDRNAFATSIVTQMSKLVGTSIEKDLDEVVLSRWGHAMVVPTTGFFGKVRKLNSTISGAYTLAHCSSQGLPSAESAIAAARQAVSKALKSKHTTYIHFPDTPLKPQLESST